MTSNLEHCKDLGASIRIPLSIVALAMALTSATAWAQSPQSDKLARDEYGGIIRGDVNTKKLALVFTGDVYGESAEPILDTFKQRKIKAAFFVTGNFLRTPTLRPLVKRMIAEGHYVGPHSDKHSLYASWDERDKSLVTEQQFKSDLRKNIADLQAAGALRNDGPVFFIPPYEWFNRDQVRWSRELGVTLFNFTPGSGSNRDYAPEGDSHFVPSRTIYGGILTYETKDPHGLNGLLLLMHLGSGRKDPFHPLLGSLCDELAKRGYSFERVDKLLSK